MAVVYHVDDPLTHDHVNHPGHGRNDPETLGNSARNRLRLFKPDRIDSACHPHTNQRAEFPRFPRTTAIGNSARSRSAVAVRKRVAPAPTGSSTIGMFCAAAARPAMRIASVFVGESMPRLRTSACAAAAISATSSGASAITGRAPNASVTFATSFATTALVR